MAITTGLKVCYRFNAASRLKSKICAGHSKSVLDTPDLRGLTLNELLQQEGAQTV